MKYPYITRQENKVVVFNPSPISDILHHLHFKPGRLDRKKVFESALREGIFEDLLKHLGPKKTMYYSSPMVWKELGFNFKVPKDETLWLSQIKNEKFVDSEITNSGYVFLRKPYFHQKQAFVSVLTHPRFSLMYDMGLGKTYVSISAMDFFSLLNPNWKFLVIAPKSVLTSWAREIEEFSYALKPQVIDSKNKNLDPSVNVYLSNYEIIWRRQDLFKPGMFQMCVLDEAHYIANPSSKRSRGVRKLTKKSERVLQLTGTPQSNKCSDLIGQFLLIDEGKSLGSWYGEFNKRFMYDKSLSPYPEFEIKDGAFEEIVTRISAHSLRRTKEECLDLPSRVMVPHFLELGSKQKRFYKRKFIELEAENSISSILELCKVANGWTGPSQAPEDLPENVKLDSLKELLSNLGANRKFIIWTRFQPDCEILLKSLSKDYNCVGYFGSQGNQDDIDKFTNDPDCRGFIGTISKGGTGLNLTAATDVFFYSLETSYRLIAQALDRNYRIGQDSSVTVHFLVAQETVDASLYYNYLSHGKLFSKIINNISQKQEEFSKLLRGAKVA